MKKSAGQLLALSAAISLFASVHQAKAQTAGTYTGTIADGNGVSIVVGTDTNGNTAITGFSYGFNSTCRPGSTPFNSGWGLGLDQVITRTGKGNFVFSFGYLYLTATVTFSGSTATGTVATLTPTFAPVASGKPKRAVFCSEPKQTFTASLTGAAASVPKGQTTATVFIPANK